MLVFLLLMVENVEAIFKNNGNKLFYFYLTLIQQPYNNLKIQFFNYFSMFSLET